MTKLKSLPANGQLTPAFLMELFGMDVDRTRTTPNRVDRKYYLSLYQHIAEIELLSLEEPRLIGIGPHVREEYIEGLHTTSWEVWGKMPFALIARLPDLIDGAIQEILSTAVFHLDPWAVYMVKNRHRMPPWGTETSRWPFGAGRSKNLVSFMVAESCAIESNGPSHYAAAFAHLCYVLYQIEMGWATYSAARESYIHLKSDEDHLKILFLHRYRIDCVKTNTIPSREGIRAILDGHVTYDYSTPEILFSW